MEQDRKLSAAPKGGLSYSVVDAVTSIGIFAVGVVMMFDNYKLGAGWAKDGPESGYFPFRIGAILCIASVAVLLKALFAPGRRREAFVAPEKFKSVLMVLLPTTAYVLAIQFAGIYVASALFIAAFMRVMDRYSWLKTAAVSIGINAALFWLFEMQFMVPLPKGPLEAMLGY
jgi:putative tricarboxylic transport membrane protein